MMYRVFCILLLAIGLLPAFAGEPDHVKTAAAIVLAENQFRQLGGPRSEKIVQKFFGEDAGKKWISEVSSFFSREQLADFFAGTVVFQGKIRPNGVVLAYYNCWWDAILLCDGFFENVTVDKRPLMIVKISDFQFLDGSIYRQGTGGKPDEKTSNVIPLIVQNMRNMQRSEVEFQKRSISYSQGGLAEEYSGAENTRMLQSHSAMRMKRRCLLLESRSAFLETEGLKKLLARGSEAHFNLLFPTPLSLLMEKNFCALPSELRSSFRLYDSYLPPEGKKTRLYVFLNRQSPRIAAIFHLGENPRKNLFYFLDVGNYEEFLKLCDLAQKTEMERKK